MKIVSRFMLDGSTTGYVIDDDGLEYSVTEIGLYDQTVLEGLIAAGYKVLGYYGNIVTPSGISIKDIELSPFTGSEEEKLLMLDMQDTALTESEASRYFSRDVEIAAVELAPSTEEIKTREELIKYLYKWDTYSRSTGNDRDVRPLNSFVSKDALFTVEEYLTDSDVKSYMRIIDKRRVLRSASEMDSLIKFLQKNAGLGSDYTDETVKEAYLSWGICGFATAITGIRSELNVTADIYDFGVATSATNKNTGRVPELCPMDDRGNIFFSNGKVNFIETHELSEDGEVVIANLESYEDAIRTTSRWETKYNTVKCWVRKAVTRTFITMMDTDGATYRAKVDPDRMVIQGNADLVLVTNFLQYMLPDGSYTTFDVALDSTKATNLVLARVKARELVRNRTIDTPVNDSFNLCINEGVAPQNALNYMARSIVDHAEVNGGIYDGTVKYYDAAEMYRLGPSKELIEKYNPRGLEYDTVDEIIDIMVATREEMMAEGTYLAVDSKDDSPEAEAIRKELARRPIEQLEFARNALAGLVSIDYLGMGKSADAGDTVDELANFLLQILKLELGDGINNTGRVKQMLAIIEQDNLFNYVKVVPERVEAYRGYLRDRAILNAARAKQCTLAAYITRVYREAANVPLEEQRHYAFEAVTLDKTNKNANQYFEKFCEYVQKAVNKSNLSFHEKRVADIAVPTYALQLMFGLYLKTIEGVIEDEVYKIKYNPDDAFSMTIEIPSVEVVSVRNLDAFHTRQLITLYDWCEYEMTNYAWNLYCLNAKINQWSVTPKEGVSIPTYCFALNYIRKATLDLFADSFKQDIVAANAKVAVLKDEYRDNSIMLYNKTITTEDFTVDTIDAVLYPAEDETITTYYDRFSMHNKAAGEMAEPHYLKRMRLKGDVAYVNYARQFSPYPMEEVDEYAKLEDRKDKFLWMKTYQVGLLSESGKHLLAQKGNTVQRFKLSNESFSDVISWPALLNGTFRPYGVCALIGNDLIITTEKGSVRKNINLMKISEFEKLVEKGIIYQLGARQFLLRTISGDYKIDAINN